MRFEVYCDEAHPDVLASANPRMRYLMIGSLWLPANLREVIKSDVSALRRRHQAGEIKWSKVSPNRQAFYIDLIDLFLGFEENLRFRCIAVDRTELDQTLYHEDSELGFYKFYYQLLHHWILDYNVYRIFCDAKTNRDPKRLPVLARCLSGIRRYGLERLAYMHSKEKAVDSLRWFSGRDLDRFKADWQ